MCKSSEVKGLFSDYRLWAVCSSIFAGTTAVLIKVGVKGVPSNMALFIRVCVILVFAVILLAITGETDFKAVSTRSAMFLIFSGIATGLSWLFYLRAMSLGPVSKVAPIDKLSFVLSVILGIVLLKESSDWKTLLGIGVIAIGVIITLFANS